MAKIESEKVIVQNVNIPDQTSRVDAVKYHAMKEAFLVTTHPFSNKSK